MKTKFLTWLCCFGLLIASATNLSAGDSATLNFVGFSPDGKFLAFEEYGTQDGSGFAYSNYYFVNAEKNVYAAKPIKVVIEREEATEKDARRQASKRAAAKLRALKIVSGNAGSQVVSRLLANLNHDSESASATAENANSVRFARVVAPNNQKSDYTLTLKPVAVAAPHCKLMQDNAFYMFDLTLLNNARGKAPQILQHDAALPVTRGCPLEYGVSEVYVYKDKTAIFINVSTRGFEGNDVRYLVVAGKFE